jgi:hypothetical protein
LSDVIPAAFDCLVDARDSSPPLSGRVTPVLDRFDQGRLAIEAGFAAAVADLKSQTFSESKRRE